MLAAHVRKVHPMEKPTCDLCDKKYGSVDELKTHKKTKHGSQQGKQKAEELPKSKEISTQTEKETNSEAYNFEEDPLTFFLDLDTSYDVPLIYEIL